MSNAGEQGKAISSLQSEGRKFPPSADMSATAHIKTVDEYQQMYDRSLQDPDGFWLEQAESLHWFKKPTKIKNVSYKYPNVSIKWYEDGVTNVCYNCVDRHLKKRGNQTERAGVREWWAWALARRGGEGEFFG